MTAEQAVKADWDQVLHWRLRQQQLDHRGAPDAMVATTQRLCGVHAQLMSSAELALWARVDGLESGDVGRALFDERLMIKTWAMRGTLHLFAASDYPDVLAALRMQRGYNDGLLRALGMTAEEMETITEAIGSALDRACLTRHELSDEIKRLTLSRRLAELASQSWGDLLKPAAYRGYLCAGPPQGRNVTFVRPDQWLPRMRKSRSSDPLATIFRRYLHVYGPASKDDFARWWGVNPPVVRQLIERLDDELRPVEVEGYCAWMLRNDIVELASLGAATGVRIVPAFDPYVVASFRHADRLLLGEVPKTRVYRPQGWVSPVVLAGGRFAGVWKHESVRGGRIRVELFQRLKRDALRELKAEIERVRGFLHMSGEVVIE